MSDPANTSLPFLVRNGQTPSRREREAFIFILRGQREERGEGGVNLLVPRILVTKTDILQCIALGMRRIQANVFLMTWSVYKVQLLSASCQCDLDDVAETKIISKPVCLMSLRRCRARGLTPGIRGISDK